VSDIQRVHLETQGMCIYYIYLIIRVNILLSYLLLAHNLKYFLFLMNVLSLDTSTTGNADVRTFVPKV